MSQQALGDILGCDQTRISQIERGVIKEPRELAELAKALDVPLLWLRDGHPDLERATLDDLQMVMKLAKLKEADKQAVRALIDSLSAK